MPFKMVQQVKKDTCYQVWWPEWVPGNLKCTKLLRPLHRSYRELWEWRFHESSPRSISHLCSSKWPLIQIPVTAIKIINKNKEVGKMAQWLRTLAALMEKSTLVPSTHNKISQVPIIPASEDPRPSSGLHRHYTQVCIHTQIKFFKKIIQ